MLKATNNGPQNPVNIQLVLDVGGPAPVLKTSGCGGQPPTITCNLLEFSPGQSKTTTVQFRTTAGPVVFTLSYRANIASDPVPSNNMDSVTVAIQ